MLDGRCQRGMIPWSLHQAQGCLMTQQAGQVTSHLQPGDQQFRVNHCLLVIRLHDLSIYYYSTQSLQSVYPLVLR